MAGHKTRGAPAREYNLTPPRAQELALSSVPSMATALTWLSKDLLHSRMIFGPWSEARGTWRGQAPVATSVRSIQPGLTHAHFSRGLWRAKRRHSKKGPKHVANCFLMLPCDRRRKTDFLDRPRSFFWLSAAKRQPSKGSPFH